VSGANANRGRLLDGMPGPEVTAWVRVTQCLQTQLGGLTASSGGMSSQRSWSSRGSPRARAPTDSESTPKD
jgi:hypothetical protein